MPRSHRWQIFKLTLLHGGPDAGGLPTSHESGKSEPLWQGLVQYSTPSYARLVGHSGEAVGVDASLTDQSQVKSP